MRRPTVAILAMTALLPVAAAASGTPPTPPGEGPLRPGTVLRSADLRSDLALLRRAWDAMHPGLLRYETQEGWDEAFAALDRHFQVDRTLGETYLAFSRLAARVRCGHTYPSFFNQAPAVAAALFEAPRLPFHFRWLDGRMIVTRSFAADPRLGPGAEVLAVDGVPAGELLARLMSVARADGGNDGKRRDWLGVNGESRVEAFDVYWPLLFPPASSSVGLRVRGPGSAAEETTRVSLLPAADRRSAARPPPGSAPPAGPPLPDGAPVWAFRMLDARTGYLRMPSWVVYSTRWDWQGFLDRTFASLVEAGASDLVVDLRGNEGGSDVGDAIVAHLAREPVPRQAVVRKVRYRRAPDDLIPFLDTWDPSFRDWGKAAVGPEGRFYRLRRDADDDPGGSVAPRAPRFAGHLWVIVGAGNSSATFEFAQTVRQNRLGTLVGQTTGGNQRGINGGAFFFLRLPRTGLELDLPLIGQFPLEARPDAGLDPDVPVVPTPDDVAAGRDVELEAVRARIAARDGATDASRGRSGAAAPRRTPSPSP